MRGILMAMPRPVLREALWANTPGSNTYNWYKEYSEGKASSWGILSAVIFDGMTAMGTYSTYQDIKKGTSLEASIRV